MAKTLRQRQADWRGRRDLKSALFDVLNAERVRKLRAQFRPDDRPEAQALAEFFIAYPRCEFAPSMLTATDGYWYVVLNCAGNYDAAAARVALEEVTSLPIRILPCEPHADTVELVRNEVAELRRLNLWGKP